MELKQVNQRTSKTDEIRREYQKNEAYWAGKIAIQDLLDDAELVISGSQRGIPWVIWKQSMIHQQMLRRNGERANFRKLIKTSTEFT